MLPSLTIFAITACASAGNDWPSLRTRAEQHIETPSPVVAAQVQPPTAPPAEPPLIDPNAQSRLQPFASRIDEERRAVNFINERWHKQLAVFTAALARVKTSGPADSQWSKAQSELTRLNQITAEYDDALTTVNGATGQLAVLAAEGVSVTQPIAAAGKVIKSIAAAKADAAAANARARRKL